MNSFEHALTFRKELLISGKYRIIRRIGGGSFGDIYLGINISNGEVSGYFMIYYQLLVKCAAYTMSYKWFSRV